MVMCDTIGFDMGTNNWYVYLLECKRGLYCGVTVDIDRREQEHNDPNKQAKAVRRLGTPATIIYTEPYPNRSEAMKREYAIKQLTRTQKLELIKHGPNIVG